VETRPAKPTRAEKIRSMSEAAELVKDGHRLALGRFSIFQRPIAFVHEPIRRGWKDLMTVGVANAIETDMPIGAGAVSRVETSCVGLGSVPCQPGKSSQSFLKKHVRLVELPTWCVSAVVVAPRAWQSQATNKPDRLVACVIGYPITFDRCLSHLAVGNGRPGKGPPIWRASGGSCPVPGFCYRIHTSFPPHSNGEVSASYADGGVMPRSKTASPC
jgi:Coenzyme A transferase